MAGLADQRVCIWRHEDVEREWVSLRDLIARCAGESGSDEEAVALELMGVQPVVQLEPLGIVEGVAWTFRVVGAHDIDPHLTTDEREQLSQEKKGFVWNVPQSGILLRLPRGARVRIRGKVNYEDVREAIAR